MVPRKGFAGLISKILIFIAFDAPVEALLHSLVAPLSPLTVRGHPRLWMAAGVWERAATGSCLGAPDRVWSRAKRGMGVPAMYAGFKLVDLQLEDIDLDDKNPRIVSQTALTTSNSGLSLRERGAGSFHQTHCVGRPQHRGRAALRH